MGNSSNDVMKVRRMLFISRPTRPLSMPWEEAMQVIIQLLEVCFGSPSPMGTAANMVKAASGAAATLVSDAFMNPFDGRAPLSFS